MQDSTQVRSWEVFSPNVYSSASTLDITPHWIYDRIYNGSIQITKNAQRGLYLFPDEPATLEGASSLSRERSRRSVEA